MDKIKKQVLTIAIGCIGFMIFDFIVWYYLFDGLTIFLWISAVIFACLFAVWFILYKKVKLNIPYLPFNKNKNMGD
ncbi:hypothetical protein Metvu_0551 [Methanocaldococcus vulcanius M7]|uniref:Uncharacterized protein n=1 Tax=Methanocaldococcus vulcanius (strain ATCC 700851 / DSM 12094 / M7) TaxID=579137 RepID=C9RFQ8_METVM|nr:hypothetical protein [Methanocaldococcus vulcanius]ACX72410.1 hypothetical protein Metvu_0551 [Methanocaldococcus vulcanius M7]